MMGPVASKFAKRVSRCYVQRFEIDWGNGLTGGAGLFQSDHTTDIANQALDTASNLFHRIASPANAPERRSQLVFHAKEQRERIVQFLPIREVLFVAIGLLNHVFVVFEQSFCSSLGSALRNSSLESPVMSDPIPI